MDTQQKLGVLLAEDDFLVVEMIKRLLSQLGLTLLGHAVNGRQSVEMTQSLHPDVILMDIKMPELDGIEATRRIQDTCPTPVVILTAHEAPKLVQRASEAGAGAYLVKPPVAGEIERAITIAMARFNDMLRLRELNRELEIRNCELQEALDHIKTLRGLIPICASCKRIRDDQGYWQQVEIYIRDHTEADFSHGLCPECAARLYPDIFPRKE